MSNLPRKIQKLVDEKIITEVQAEKIVAAGVGVTSRLVFKTMFVIAGMLIGLGIILVIGANWRKVPVAVKLVVDFGLFACFAAGAYKSLTAEREFSIGKFSVEKRFAEELFLILCFLMTGGTIGLIVQVFHLTGGWRSFVFSWSVLSLPFVIFSSSKIFNVIWLLLLSYGMPENPLEIAFEYAETLPGLMTMVCLFGVLSYVGKVLDEKAVKGKIALPEAFSSLMLFCMYFAGIVCAGGLGMEKRGAEPVLANLFALMFLGIRMGMAFYKKDGKSFKRNALMAELFIIFLFVSRFGNLMTSGLGFIAGGILLLAFVYVLKKSSFFLDKWRSLK